MSVNINMEAEDEGHSPLASSETDVIMTAEEFQMFKSTYIVSIEKTAEELRELQIEQEKMEAEKSKMQKRIFEMENGLNKLSLSSTSAQEALRRLDLERDVSKIIENGLQEAKIQGLLEKMRHLKAQ